MSEWIFIGGYALGGLACFFPIARAVERDRGPYEDTALALFTVAFTLFWPGFVAAVCWRSAYRMAVRGIR